MREVSIHNIGHMIGNHIAKKVGKPNKENLFSYGAEILIGGIVKIFTLFIVSIFLDVAIEVAMLTLVIAITRILSGGAHSTAYYRCLTTSIIVFVSLGYAIKTMHPLLSVQSPVVLGGIMVLYIYLYWSYAPQAPTNKPFKTKEAEAVFRKYTLIAVFVLSLIPFFLGVESLASWIVACGLLWQGFTLTPVGHGFVGLMDDLLSFGRKEAKSSVEVIDKNNV